MLNGSNDTLLYDFNLNLGDTLPITANNNGGNLFYVSAIDSILIGTTYRKEFAIRDTGSSWDFDYLIEGIGSTRGLFEKITVPFEGGSSLNCFDQNYSCVYPDSNYNCPLYFLGISSIQKPEQSITTYPNPSTGKFTFTFSNPELISGEQTIEIFNVLGEQVYNETLKKAQDDNVINISKQPAGIYFYRVITEDGSFIGEGKLILQK